jgi:polyisoprenoid-binding protein YceI
MLFIYKRNITMKETIMLLLLLPFASVSYSQVVKWGYDASHAKVGFSISHFGISETEGKFTKFDGTVMAANPDFSDAKIEFKIDVNSINTEDAQRDTHLRSPDFFDAEKFPSIIFKSKSIKSTGKNTYKLVGDINIHGVTKEIMLDVIYKGTVVDPYNNTKAGFKITGVLDRTKFGLIWNGKLATGDILVGNEVNLDINIELIKQS